tara:strand:+ start:325 stop:510 length:186 start_codon:yes stop_codon:yes gene_type:complete
LDEFLYQLAGAKADADEFEYIVSVRLNEIEYCHTLILVFDGQALVTSVPNFTECPYKVCAP